MQGFLVSLLVAVQALGANGQFLRSFSSSVSWSFGRDGSMHQEEHTVQESNVIQNGELVKHMQSNVDCIDGNCAEQDTVSVKMAPLEEIAPVRVVFIGGGQEDSRLAGFLSRIMGGPRLRGTQQAQVTEQAPPPPQFFQSMGAVPQAPPTAPIDDTFVVPPFYINIAIMWSLSAIIGCSMVCLMRFFKKNTQARECVGPSEPLAPITEEAAVPLPVQAPKVATAVVAPIEEEKTIAVVEPDFHLRPSVGTWLVPRL